ncbi:hypothetical protein T484DRAFT_1757276 [Baffinella frigidus]|nr:hypothetical protein T484DRAFT_1757276 [Cryptophyta sp. CCMP2293]
MVVYVNWLMHPLRYLTLWVCTLLLTHSITLAAAATCNSAQQNDGFMALLKTIKPVGVNVFAEWNEASLQTPDMSYRPPGVSAPTHPMDPHFTDNLGVGKFVATLVPRDPIVQNPPISRCWVTYGKKFCDPPIGRDWQIAFSDETDLSATMTVSNAPFNNGVSYLKWSSFVADKPNTVNELLSGSYISPGGTTSYNGYQSGRNDDAVQFAVGNFDGSTGGYVGEESLNGVYKGEWFSFTSPDCFTMTRSQFLTSGEYTQKRRSNPKAFEIYGRNLDTDPWTAVFQTEDSGLYPDDTIEMGDTCYMQYGFTVSSIQNYQYPCNQLIIRKWYVHGQYRRAAMPDWKWKPPRMDYALLPLLNAVNPVTSMWMPAGGVISYPSTPATYTVCRSTRSQHEMTRVLTKWVVTCVTNGRSDESAYVSDQTDIGDGTVVSPYGFDIDYDYWMHSTWTWDVALSNAQMKIVTAGIRRELGGIPYGETTPVTPLSDLRAYRMRLLLTLIPPKVMNIFSDFNGVSVPDRGKTGAHIATVTEGAGALVREAADGAANEVASVFGDGDTKFFWEGGATIPQISTTCWVSRAEGRNPQNRVGMVLASHDGQYAWGHGGEHYWGYLFHSASARSNQNFVGSSPQKGGGSGPGLFSGGPTASDWKVMCAASNGAVPHNVIIDQTPIGKMGGNGANGNAYRYETQEVIGGKTYKTQYFGNPGGLNAPVSLRIGYSDSVWSNKQPFGMHSLYVWDGVLTPWQMLMVTEALRAQLGGTNEFETTPVVPMSASDTAFCLKCPEGFGVDKETGDCLNCPSGMFTTDKSECGTNVIKTATATVFLSIAPDDFTDALQRQYIAAIAIVVGVRQSQVKIVRIGSQNRRRLLQDGDEEGTEVETEVTSGEGNSLVSVKESMTSENMNAYSESSPNSGLPPMNVGTLTLVTALEVGAVVDFKGASSYAEAAIAVEFDAITYLANTYAKSYTYRIDNLLVFNFLGLEDTHYKRIRNAISDGSAFIVAKEDGQEHYTLTPDFGEDILCPEVGDTLGISTGHTKCFWRRAIVSNEVQPVARESVYFYRKKTIENSTDAAEAKTWITKTILGGNSGFSTATASNYFNRTCTRSEDPLAEPRSYGCLYVDPGYRWRSRMRGVGPSSPFMISDKTIVVAIITIATEDGVVVRRRLLSADNMATQTLDLPLPDASSLDIPGVENSRHLLQGPEGVANTVGTSALQVTNAGVNSDLNLMYIGGHENHRAQLMQIEAVRRKDVPFAIYASNTEQVMGELSRRGGYLGDLVNRVHPVGFVTTSTVGAAGRRLLQDDRFTTMDITAIVEMYNAFGNVFINGLECVLVSLAMEKGILSTSRVKEITDVCTSGVIPDTVTNAMANYTMSNGSIPAINLPGMVHFVLSTCTAGMTVQGSAACNILRGVLMKMEDLPSEDWNFIAQAQAAFSFSMDFDIPPEDMKSDSIFRANLRQTVAEVLRVAVDRVVVEFGGTPPTARRLLQTSGATRAVVTVFKDDRQGFKTSEFNTKEGGELELAYTRVGGWEENIKTLLQATPALSFITMGPAVTGNSIAAPAIPTVKPYVVTITVGLVLDTLTSGQSVELEKHIRAMFVDDIALDPWSDVTTRDIAMRRVTTTPPYTDFVIEISFGSSTVALNAAHMIYGNRQQLARSLVRRMQTSDDEDILTITAEGVSIKTDSIVVPASELYLNIVVQDPDETDSTLGVGTILGIVAGVGILVGIAVYAAIWWGVPRKPPGATTRIGSKHTIGETLSAKDESLVGLLQKTKIQMFVV